LTKEWKKLSVYLFFGQWIIGGRENGENWGPKKNHHDELEIKYTDIHFC
jgi:hypothetical protein